MPTNPIPHRGRWTPASPRSRAGCRRRSSVARARRSPSTFPSFLPRTVALDEIPEPVHVIGELAGLEPGPLRVLVLGALPRGSRHVVEPVHSDDDGTIGVE